MNYRPVTKEELIIRLQKKKSSIHVRYPSNCYFVIEVVFLLNLKKKKTEGKHFFLNVEKDIFQSTTSR